MAVKPPKPVTARRHLELSQLNPNAIQRGLMNDDIGWEKFRVWFNGVIGIPQLSGRITAASVNRTIEGASTLTIEVNDYDRALLSSGRLAEGLDVQIDGLWFRLTAIDKQNDSITLTFQDREIEILRTYNKWRIAKRGDMTRAEFVLSLIREVKEFQIPIVIPQLHKIQPIEEFTGDIIGVDTVTQKGPGIPKDINNSSAKDRYNHRDSETQYKASPSKLRVKNAVATEVQIANANTILQMGTLLGVSRKVKVIAMMTAITETRILNDPGGPNAHNKQNDLAGDDSAGVFQQRPSWGSYEDRTDVATSARLFYKAAVSKVAELNPDTPYWEVAAQIQHPKREYETRYAVWRIEAERFVNAFGDLGSTVSDANAMNPNMPTYGTTGSYYFIRGKIDDKRGTPHKKPENTWSCTQRLADEVDWRSFFVSGTYYFISEGDLFKQLPLATISEFSPSVKSFNGNYDRHKKAATIELEVFVGAWAVPPGAVVVVKDVGHPFDGRWLVSSFERDLIGDNKVATVSLKKPRPALPEPLQDPNAQDISGAGWVPQQGGSQKLPPTTQLINQVLANKNIHFKNSKEVSDIQFGEIDDRVMSALLFLANKGYPIYVTALKSDHGVLTSEGDPSAHGFGRAVDIGRIGETAMAENDVTRRMMIMLASYQVVLGFAQLIGPWPELVIPLGIYDSKVLGEHKDHIHLGWHPA